MKDSLGTKTCRAFAASLLLISWLTLSPASVIADDGATPATAATDAAPAKSEVDGVEIRIKELHDKLKITSDQEAQWEKIATEMRNHAKEAHDLATAREKAAGTMTAVDDLKSYLQIAQSHAGGMERFLTLFTPLYESMPDDQKKNADSVFREHKVANAKKHRKALNKKS